MSRVNLEKNKSQRQECSLILKKNILEINGYQKFKMTNKEIIYDINNCGLIGKERTKHILNIIDKNQSNCKSLLDLGCAQGFFSLYSYFKNYEVFMVDHDNEYINQLNKIKKILDLNINLYQKKFSEINIKADIVLFLALLHWIFDTTDYFNSFDKIIKKLYDMSNKIVIIEWITNNGQVKNFKDYNIDNFKKSLKIFSKVERKPSKKNRELFICYK